MLFSLIYMSKACGPMDHGALHQLLETARAYNHDHGITGMLLYNKMGQATDDAGRFIQVLEGVRPEVLTLFEKIKTDDRHLKVKLLYQTEIRERSFRDWSMGFAALTEETAAGFPGYFELNDDFLLEKPKEQFDMAMIFLRSFYQLSGR
ncbi:BLUF domain-containing protein [Mucilaginibacter corticis]|uniref:BLUF domain-containing protein n=1 Tax=Mucilaginibacter corticis TaxID=2597670 RepID=A0A556MX54_9SPHI|nr:BLUF domain-containing protein [Mucilaginibacter corticis]TSJ44462.1 BLUF domain-containing protein [Mucilaginibacter corticis]